MDSLKEARKLVKKSVNPSTLPESSKWKERKIKFSTCLTLDLNHNLKKEHQETVE